MDGTKSSPIMKPVMGVHGLLSSNGKPNINENVSTTPSTTSSTPGSIISTTITTTPTSIITNPNINKTNLPSSFGVPASVTTSTSSSKIHQNFVPNILSNANKSSVVVITTPPTPTPSVTSAGTKPFSTIVSSSSTSANVTQTTAASVSGTTTASTVVSSSQAIPSAGNTGVGVVKATQPPKETTTSTTSPVVVTSTTLQKEPLGSSGLAGVSVSQTVTAVRSASGTTKPLQTGLASSVTGSTTVLGSSVSVKGSTPSSTASVTAAVTSVTSNVTPGGIKVSETTSSVKGVSLASGIQTTGKGSEPPLTPGEKSAEISSTSTKVPESSKLNQNQPSLKQSQTSTVPPKSTQASPTTASSIGTSTITTSTTTKISSNTEAVKPTNIVTASPVHKTPTKSGLLVLEHPSDTTSTKKNTTGPVNLPATSATGREREQGKGEALIKEPGQLSTHNQIINLSSSNNHQENQSINKSGSNFSQAPSTVTNLPTATAKSSQLPPVSSSSSSGTNPVSSVLQSTINPGTANTVNITASSAPQKKAELKMEDQNKAAAGDTNGLGNSVKTDAASDADMNMKNNNEAPQVNGKSGTNVPAQSSVSAELDIVNTSCLSDSPLCSDTELPSNHETAPSHYEGIQLKESIGEDVKMVIDLIEKAGLCGPQSFESQSVSSSRPGTAGSDIPPARPSTADKSYFQTGSTPTAGGDGPPVESTLMTPGKKANAAGDGPVNGNKTNRPTTARSRPSTGKGVQSKSPKAEDSTRSPASGNKDKTPGMAEGRPGTATGVRTPISIRPPTGAKSRPSTGMTRSPGDKLSKTPNGNAGGVGSVSRGTPREGSRGKSVPNSTTTTPVEPKVAKSPRTITPRAASARVSNTTPLSPKSLTDEESKLKKSSRSKSGGNTPLEARPKSAFASSSDKDNNKGSSTPRSRPSSTLYQHTASSAQKGLGTGTLSPTSPAVQTTSSRASPSSSSFKTSRSSTGPRTPRSKMGDSAASGAGGDVKPATLQDQFAAFSRFGDTSSDGKHITLSNSDKWMKQARVIDPKKITTTDTSICFKKLFKTTKKVSFEDFKKYIEDLAKGKKVEPQEIFDKLTNCGPPGLSSHVKAAHAGVVERLTDTSKYTGSHKERFDSTGKGKGIDGRRDVADSSGYVSSFKNKLDLNKDSKEESPKGSGTTSPAPPAKEASPTPAK